VSTQPVGFLGAAERLRTASWQFKNLRKQLMCDLRVAMPATVISFDEDAMTVVVQPAVMEELLVNSVPTFVNIPPLQDVPVFIPRGGGYSITFPIQSGDECLLIFGDMSIDGWWQNGGSSNTQPMKRRHNLSDAFALFGISSQPNTLDDYSTDSLQIRSDDGTLVIDVNESTGQISVTAPTGVVITAPSITLDGDVSVSGTLGVTGTATLSGGAVLSGTTSIDGIAWSTHFHTGVTTGSGDTGPPA
jgi:hypothetical protein